MYEYFALYTYTYLYNKEKMTVVHWIQDQAQFSSQSIPDSLCV